MGENEAKYAKMKAFLRISEGKVRRFVPRFVLRSACCVVRPGEKRLPKLTCQAKLGRKGAFLS